MTDKYRNVRNEYYYDAFGNVLDSKEQIHNRITYTGQQFDGVTGQYYLRARFYNPVIGEFTQEDIYRGDGLNLYAYCGNNPVGYWDPSGYVCEGKGNSFDERSEATQDYVKLYHGTSNDAASSIRSNGVDLNHGIRNMDFGRGFYTTTDLGQAKNWVEHKFKGNGEVLEFNIPKSEFDNLNNKVFTSADVEWENFVRNSRKGMTNSYDTISGPMLRNPIKKFYEGRVSAKSSGQQTAFNTQNAIDLLNKYMKGK
nr:RHS repeat-associated core domain-containing protein [Clostridium saccharobutylicum]